MTTAIEQCQLIDAAEVAVAQLNNALADGLFPGIKFVAKRSWAAFAEELKECNGLLVDCVPARYESSEMMSDTRAGYEPAVEVYVRERFGPNDLDQKNRVPDKTADKLANFVQALDVMFKSRRVPGLNPDSEIKVKMSEILVSCSRPHLKDMQQFFGAIKVVYTAAKEITPE